MPGDALGPAHWRAVYDVANGWRKSRATGKMHNELRRQCRIAAGRQPEPTAAVIDSQSMKAAEEVSRAPRQPWSSSRNRDSTARDSTSAACSSKHPSRPAL